MNKKKLMLAVLLTGMVYSCICSEAVIHASIIETEIDPAVSSEYSTQYTYDQLTSDPGALIDQKIRVMGKIIETCGSCPATNRNAPERWFRLCMDNDTHQILFISFEEDLVDYRLLDDDRMVVDGVVNGTYDYESPSGVVRALPWIRADRIERTGTHELIVREGQEVKLLKWKNGAILGEYESGDQ